MSTRFLFFLSIFLLVACDKDDIVNCAVDPFDEDEDGVLCNEDCDDNDASVSKQQLYYIDSDGDTFGDKNDAGTPFCEGLDPTGYSAVNTDCDDTDAAINPAAPQGCDGVDTNCDGLTEPPKLITVTQLDTICSINASCTEEISLPFTIASICDSSNVNVQISVDLNNDGSVDQMITKSELEGGFPNYTLTGAFPLGSHTLTISIENCSCGEDLLIPLVIKDCKAPSPICTNGLLVKLQPLEAGIDADGDGDFDAGSATISATDIIASPSTDCSEPIVYSINFVMDPPNINQNTLLFTCDNPENSLLEVHAWDQLGNVDFCETYVVLDKTEVSCE